MADIGIIWLFNFMYLFLVMAIVSYMLFAIYCQLKWYVYLYFKILLCTVLILGKFKDVCDV